MTDEPRQGITVRPDQEVRDELKRWAEWTGLSQNQLALHALRLMMGLPTVFSINPPPSPDDPEKPTPPNPE